ncbi:hypothetical protein PQX77_019569 [Marasmius sp. AFHP31]|nr:hypothetical protein PQX77_019569 [Marasmius sp. AFHP31]
MTTKTDLIIGATGHLLKELLESPFQPKKLEQEKIDFDKLEDDGSLKGGNWDVVFITWLGTTKANAGSAEAFEKLTENQLIEGTRYIYPTELTRTQSEHRYVLRAAKEARKSSDLSRPQRHVYFSASFILPLGRRLLMLIRVPQSNGANVNSPFLHPRSEGLTEYGLASLGCSDTIIFRPGLQVGTERSQYRTLESVYGKLTGFLSYFSSSFEIKVCFPRLLMPELVLIVTGRSQAMANAGLMGTENLPSQAQAMEVGKEGAKFMLIGNSGALELAKVDLYYE